MLENVSPPPTVVQLKKVSLYPLHSTAVEVVQSLFQVMVTVVVVSDPPLLTSLEQPGVAPLWVGNVPVSTVVSDLLPEQVVSKVQFASSSVVYCRTRVRP